MSDFSKENEISRRFGEHVRRSQFCLRLAEQLEREFGPCPARRDQLMAWLDDQLDRCTALGVPGDAALAMINSGYVEWCALLLERDQPDDQEREELFP